jgi:hypothetical protein
VYSKTAILLRPERIGNALCRGTPGYYPDSTGNKMNTSDEAVHVLSLAFVVEWVESCHQFCFPSVLFIFLFCFFQSDLIMFLIFSGIYIEHLNIRLSTELIIF